MWLTDIGAAPWLVSVSRRFGKECGPSVDFIWLSQLRWCAPPERRAIQTTRRVGTYQYAQHIGVETLGWRVLASSDSPLRARDRRLQLLVGRLLRSVQIDAKSQATILRFTEGILLPTQTLPFDPERRAHWLLRLSRAHYVPVILSGTASGWQGKTGKISSSGDGRNTALPSTCPETPLHVSSAKGLMQSYCFSFLRKSGSTQTLFTCPGFNWIVEASKGTRRSRNASKVGASSTGSSRSS